MIAADHVLLTLRCLSRRADLGLVPLSELRKMLPGADLETPLLHLRHLGVVQLVTHDGRHRSPTDEQRAAAIVEGERTFVYAKLVEARQAELELVPDPGATPLPVVRSAAPRNWMTQELGGRLGLIHALLDVDTDGDADLDQALERLRRAQRELDRTATWLAERVHVATLLDVEEDLAREDGRTGGAP